MPIQCTGCKDKITNLLSMTVVVKWGVRNACLATYNKWGISLSNMSVRAAVGVGVGSDKMAFVPAVFSLSIQLHHDTLF